MIPEAVSDGLMGVFGLSVGILELRAERDQLILNFHGKGKSGTQTPIQIGNVNSIQITDGAEKLLGRVDPKEVRLELVLDPVHAMSRIVRIPRAAAKELTGVLSFEIERHTPYRQDEVLFGHDPDPASSDDDNLGLSLTIVPKETIEKICQPLKAYGFHPDAVRVSGHRISVSADAEAGEGGSGGLPAFGVAAVILLVALLISPLIRMQVSAADTKAKIEAARGSSAASTALKGNVVSLQNRVRRIARAKAGSPSMIQILDSLAALLPDGTWLQSVNLVDGEIVIEGATDSSSALVKLLEASPLFGSVNYVSPVIRERGGAIERFSFSLKLAKG